MLSVLQFSYLIGTVFGLGAAARAFFTYMNVRRKPPAVLALFFLFQVNLIPILGLTTPESDPWLTNTLADVVILNIVLGLFALNYLVDLFVVNHLTFLTVAATALGGTVIATALRYHGSVFFFDGVATVALFDSTNPSSAVPFFLLLLFTYARCLGAHFLYHRRLSPTNRSRDALVLLRNLGLLGFVYALLYFISVVIPGTWVFRYIVLMGLYFLLAMRQILPTTHYFLTNQAAELSYLVDGSSNLILIIFDFSRDRLVSGEELRAYRDRGMYSATMLNFPDTGNDAADSSVVPRTSSAGHDVLLCRGTTYHLLYFFKKSPSPAYAIVSEQFMTDLEKSTHTDQASEPRSGPPAAVTERLREAFVRMMRSII
jgi:hypothetical protein